MEFSLRSPAFSHGGTIPHRYTCQGEELSPPLEWSGTPEGTQSLVLIVDDPDVPDPDAPAREWVHWVVYNISPHLTRLEEGASGTTPGLHEGMNDSGLRGFDGFCPPQGRHRYFHKLYALDIPLPDLLDPDKGTIERAMHGHILAKAELMGVYG